MLYEYCHHQRPMHTYIQKYTHTHQIIFSQKDSIKGLLNITIDDFACKVKLLKVKAFNRCDVGQKKYLEPI